MRHGLEFRHNDPPTIHPENEIVKWDGEFCFTVAVFKHHEKEGRWYLESVGDRLVGLDGEELMREIEKGFEHLERSEA